MKAVVNKETCIGCGLCAQISPEVYEMQGDTAVAISDVIPADKEEAAKNGSDQCPVSAITIS